MNKLEFIERVGEYAHKDMIHSRILASVTIAQAILESSWGNSELAKKCNNLFGIKGSYQGEFGIFKTKECYSGKWVTVDARFRKYPSWLESVIDHSCLFLTYTRYKNLIGDTDYERVCFNLQKDGYATDPDYPSKLIRLIEQYNLVRFDEIKRVGEYSGNSIKDYLDSIGEDSSFTHRKELAKKYKILGYKGTEKQNLKLLACLRNG